MTKRQNNSFSGMRLPKRQTYRKEYNEQKAGKSDELYMSVRQTKRQERQKEADKRRERKTERLTAWEKIIQVTKQKVTNHIRKQNHNKNNTEKVGSLSWTNKDTKNNLSSKLCIIKTDLDICRLLRDAY